jgi:ElaB/YqjD/DUF883 family membrane-anchored ribosome-binding protein
MTQSQTHSYDGKQQTSFKDGVSKVSAGFDATKEDLSNLVHDAAGAAKSGISEANKAVKRTVENGRQTAAQAVDGVTVRISENPLTSVALAAGVGLAIGYFLKRTSR